MIIRVKIVIIRVKIVIIRVKIVIIRVKIEKKGCKIEKRNKKFRCTQQKGYAPLKPAVSHNVRQVSRNFLEKS